MADSDAVRQQRRRRHRQGDHSMCRRNCRDSAVSLRVAEVSRSPGENTDPAARLEELAETLLAAYQADPSNAALARECRATLLVLRQPSDGGADAEFGALIRELSTPVYTDDTDWAG